MMSTPWKVNGVIFRLQGPLFLNLFAVLPIPWASFRSSVCHEEQVNAP